MSASFLDNELSICLNTYIYVTGFWKTDQDVMHEVNKISMFKNL